MRSKYKIIDNEQIYFVTSTIVQWVPIFTSEKYFQILINSLNFSVEKQNLEIYAWVIMDNHFHLVCSSPNISSIIQGIKRYTAKRIITQLKYDNKNWLLNLFKYYKATYKRNSKYQVWQEGFHPKMIINEEMFRQKIEYIHYNPVRRGLVAKPEDWLYSSAKFFLSGEESLVKLSEF